MNDGGKGSKPRPISVSNEEYANRWDAIFQRDKKNDVLTKSIQTENERMSMYKNDTKDNTSSSTKR
jgi:hypothetical protein